MIFFKINRCDIIGPTSSHAVLLDLGSDFSETHAFQLAYNYHHTEAECHLSAACV